MSKMGQFPRFGSQSAKKGARNPLFNKLFGPGRKMGARMQFSAAKLVFGRQKVISGPKSPKIPFLDPKITSWDRFRALAQKAYESNGFGAPFSHFWSQKAKIGSFFHFWAKNAKMAPFCVFGAKNAKMSPFSVFGSQSAQKGS